ncbi:MAG: hypothetical protein ACUVV1_10850 [Fimbriimonadales bacterium]
MVSVIRGIGWIAHAVFAILLIWAWVSILLKHFGVTGVVVGLLFAPMSLFVFLYEGLAHGNWLPVALIVGWVLMHWLVGKVVGALSANPHREELL